MTDSRVKAHSYDEHPVQDGDPLMELSRIIGFDQPVADTSQHGHASADDALTLDLERELFSSFGDDFTAEMPANDHYANDHTAQNPGDSDHLIDPTVYQPAIEPDGFQANQYHETPVHAPVYVEPPSLEDELENLLFGDNDDYEAVAEPAPYQVPFAAVEYPQEPELSPELSPELYAPEFYASEAYVPEAQVPEAYVPEAQVPEAYVPEAYVPEAYVPEVQAPEFYAPELEAEELQVAEPEPQAHQPVVSAHEQSAAYPYYTRSNFGPGAASVHEPAPAYPQSDYRGDNSAGENLVEDFAAQNSIESGAFTASEVAFSPDNSELPEDIDLNTTSVTSPFSLEEMVFDDSEFAIDKTEEFELTSPVFLADDTAHPAHGPELDGPELDDSAEPVDVSQVAFDWDPIFNAAQEFAPEDFAPEDFAPEQDADFSAPELEPTVAQPDDNFFSAQDLDFTLDDALEFDPVEDEFASEPLVQPAPQEQPAYAHAQIADEPRSAPFPHYAGQRSVLSAPAPDVESLTVSDSKVEQTHALDLPEVAYHDVTQNVGLNDLEAEFAEVFSSIGVEEPSAAQDESTAADQAFNDIFRQNFSGLGAAAAGAGAGMVAAVGASAASTTAPVASTQPANADDYYNHWAAADASGIPDFDDVRYSEADTYDTVGADARDNGRDDNLNDEFGRDLGAASAAYRDKPVRGRRGLLLATVAGALVLVGGIGYHFLGDGNGSGEPAVIRADTQPIKMQPENPGGATVPNQDKAVYDRVAGTIPKNPEQKTLVTSGQQPVDLAANEDEFGSFDEDADNGPLPSSITGVDNSADTALNEPKPLIVPRQVQTMIVKADGTIVQQAANTSAPVEAMPTAPSNQDASDLARAQQLASAQPVTSPLEAAPKVAPRVVETETIKPPAKAPVVPSRPSEQPTTIVGAVAPKIAETPTASAVAPGTYLIQIASQPSAAAAQQSYATMAQKYAGVIGGRGVDIRKADVAGKGTYYRVRVAAGTKADANELCNRLKAAGGSCFVTQ